MTTTNVNNVDVFINCFEIKLVESTKKELQDKQFYDLLHNNIRFIVPADSGMIYC